MNRRSFISSTALAGAAIAARSRLFAADAGPRPKVGLIGCGFFGGTNLGNFARYGNVEVVSLCDPNASALKKLHDGVAQRQPTSPGMYADYREMLASRPHDIVIVATPDHWHALPAIAAMQAGADVWLEKPVGMDVLEGEALVAAARKYERVVQVNLQRRSSPLYAELREKFIRSGRLGPVGLVEAYCYLDNRPAGRIPTADPPAHLDYELWTGPAPLLPFHPAIESGGWRSFMEYGNGIIGDMGVHIIDHVRWMLDLGWPESIRSTGGIYVDRESSANISDTQRAVIRYANLDVSWEHRTWGASPIPRRHWTDQWGARFLGKNGTLMVSMLGYEFTPAGGGQREGFHMLSKTGDLENVNFSQWFNAYNETHQRHVTDFLTARKNRSRPVADIEEGHISSACCVLANLAQELDRPISYDPQTRTVRDDPDATRRLVRAYREPWLRPDPASV